MVKRFDKLVYVRDALRLVPPGRYIISDLRERINEIMVKRTGKECHFNTIKNLMLESTLIQQTYPEIRVEDDGDNQIVKIGLSETMSRLSVEDKIYYVLYTLEAFNPDQAVDISNFISIYRLRETLDIMLDRGYVLEESGKLFIPEIIQDTASKAALKVNIAEAPIDENGQKLLRIITPTKIDSRFRTLHYELSRGKIMDPMSSSPKKIDVLPISVPCLVLNQLKRGMEITNILSS